MIDVSGAQKPLSPACSTNLTTSGLGLLYRAYRYAQDASQDPWEFAVEISELHAVGLTNADFRWLLCKGLVTHAREILTADGDRRQFDFGDSLRFCPRSCFQLTEAGLEIASTMFDDAISASMMPFVRRPAQSIAAEVKPKWDGERHRFFVCEQLVKEFKVPSPNQETILTAFEEEDWPIRIDDPLPPGSQADGKRRLHDAIKGLNRNQKRNLIRFMGDGTGEGILWELTEAPPSAQ
ncbi:MAG: hypothetical protein KF861_02595 [Planctomycetaceae bacterium]|nr:hypothetical protein [Planctomycetaceae bacterium]